MAELMAALPDILAAPKTDAPIDSLCLRPGRGGGDRLQHQCRADRRTTVRNRTLPQ